MPLQRNPSISPYLYYEDAAAAMDWLIKAFGLRERLRITNDDGTVQHGELELGGGVVMLGQPGAHSRRYDAEDIEGQPLVLAQRIG